MRRTVRVVWYSTGAALLVASMLVLTAFGFALLGRGALGIGFGLFDIGVTPRYFDSARSVVDLGLPYLTRGGSSPSACADSKVSHITVLDVRIVLQTCNRWAGQPLPTAVPTAVPILTIPGSQQTAPVPVRTGAPRVP